MQHLAFGFPKPWSQFFKRTGSPRGRWDDFIRKDFKEIDDNVSNWVDSASKAITGECGIGPTVSHEVSMRSGRAGDCIQEQMDICWSR